MASIDYLHEKTKILSKPTRNSSNQDMVRDRSSLEEIQKKIRREKEDILEFIPVIADQEGSKRKMVYFKLNPRQ